MEYEDHKDNTIMWCPFKGDMKKHKGNKGLFLLLEIQLGHKYRTWFDYKLVTSIFRMPAFSGIKISDAIIAISKSWGTSFSQQIA